MMTQSQISELSHYYHIDEFTIRREYIQILFLNSLYQQSEATQIYFKGGLHSGFCITFLVFRRTWILPQNIVIRR